MVQGIYSIADMDSLLQVKEKEVLDKCNQNKQQSSEKEWIMIDSFE
jgi:hypothetical protein